MRSDKFGNTIYESNDIVDLLYNGNIDKLDQIFCDTTVDTEKLESVANTKLKHVDPMLYDIGIEEFDQACQQDWFMPEEYKNMDIEGFLVAQCPKEHYQRLIDELGAFKERNMLDLLRWLKYFVDTCKKEGIVWGVGRGSSVSSYVLYLIGVHKIDPIKYKLDWQDFLR